MLKVSAVIVTHNSSNHIQRLINELLTQSISFYKLVVIDNASKDDTVNIIKSFSDYKSTIDLHVNKANLGGAGGYRVGFERALKYDCDYIISFDDDVKISDKDYLKTIINYAQLYKMDVVGSLVISIGNRHKTAHKYLLNGKRTTSVDKLIKNEKCIDEFKVFNGTLFSSKVIENLKGPDPRFFIRGDEVEFRSRINNLPYKTSTCVDAVIYHPEITGDEVLFRGNWISYVDHKGKQYFSTRNRYYLYINRVKHHHNNFKMIRILFKDLIIYTQYYFVSRKDPIGYIIWLVAFIDGITVNLNSNFSKYIKIKYFS